MSLVLARADTVRCTQMQGHSVPKGFPSALQCSESDSQPLQVDNPPRRRMESVMRIWVENVAVYSKQWIASTFFNYWQNAPHLMRYGHSATVTSCRLFSSIQNDSVHDVLPSRNSQWSCLQNHHWQTLDRIYLNSCHFITWVCQLWFCLCRKGNITRRNGVCFSWSEVWMIYYCKLHLHCPQCYI